MYSFTKPKPKPYFKEDTRLWLIFYAISIFLYVSFSLFLLLKAYLFNRDINYFNKEIKSLNKKIDILKKEKENITIQKNIYQEILTKNYLIKQNVKNLFDLIPDPITLNKFLLSKNKLILYGITPTKDVYNLLLLPPLESIFEETKTYFYELPNGWYKFKSINTLKSEDENTFN